MIGIDGLAFAAVTPAQQLLELMLQLLIERDLLPERLGEFADLAVRRGDVVGQRRVVVRHTYYYGES